MKKRTKKLLPEIIIQDPAWRKAVPNLTRLIHRATLTAGGAATVVLSNDRTLRTLNRTHRGIDKPTNILTFEGAGGELILAFATIKREATTARRPLPHHLTHLLIHGTLHLRGQDHLTPAQARHMEMAESRLLHHLGIPNPWKPRITS